MSSVRVFATDGGPDCTGSPPVCQPLWRTDRSDGWGRFSVAVGANRLYVPAQTSNNSGVYQIAVYDTDPSGCSGTPVVCQPLWTTEQVSPEAIDPILANGLLLVQGQAFDTTSLASCSGTPPVCPDIVDLPLFSNVVVGGRLVGMGPIDTNYGNVSVYRLP